MWDSTELAKEFGFLVRMMALLCGRWPWNTGFYCLYIWYLYLCGSFDFLFGPRVMKRKTIFHFEMAWFYLCLLNPFKINFLGAPGWLSH